MLKLEKVNKYFNRHKKNQIHVINNTSLEFPESGLIALLGESGCGKTTLLNAIGGLDKINNGKIILNNKKLPKRNSNRKDKMRVLNIGYIFQDYNLLESLTVYENIELSLKMIGIKNKKEIKSRIDYVLEKVDMYRYRNKPAGMLSGGEKQRVGIARAIVKNPSIIIADEPTGNLDSKNTIEIMNIIKAISNDKLVILVTHEKDLAHFYASRIINLEDGRVVGDNDNTHENELDYRIDNRLYLKDFKNHDKLSDKNHKINLYSDDDDKLDLDIVIKNNNIYIRSKKQSKLEIVDENSSIELIDAHYKKISKEDYEKSNFDLNRLDNSKYRLKYTSIYNIFTMLKSGFKKVTSYSMMKKILLIGFLVSAMFIVFAISNTFGNLNIQDKDFVSTNRNYIQIKNNSNKVDEYLALEQDAMVDYILPGDSNVTFNLITKDIYQFDLTRLQIGGSLASINLVDNIIYGTKGSDTYSIVIDKLIIDKLLEDNNFKMVGINNYEDFLNRTLRLNNLNDFTITGISDTNSPCIYANDVLFTNIIANKAEDNGNNYMMADSSENEDTRTDLVDYDLVKDNITIKSGRAPENDYEVIVNINNKESMPLWKNIDKKVNGKKLYVVGHYYSEYGKNEYYVTGNTIKYNNIKKNSSLMIYSKDKDSTIEYLKEKGYNALDTYENSRKDYIKSVKKSIIESLIIAGILLVISFIEIFLMIRASFLSRIKEVGIYRAIGVKKSDIYKMFLGEILVITTIASVPGYILMSLILNEISKIKYLSGMFIIDAKVLIVSIILIYGLNILMGLLPIHGVIKKTPAQILARNDVD